MGADGMGVLPARWREAAAPQNCVPLVAACQAAVGFPTTSRRLQCAINTPSSAHRSCASPSQLYIACHPQKYACCAHSMNKHPALTAHARVLVVVRLDLLAAAAGAHLALAPRRNLAAGEATGDDTKQSTGHAIALLHQPLSASPVGQVSPFHTQTTSSHACAAAPALARTAGA